MSPSTFSVAIIGGGFSGGMVFAHLAEKASAGLSVALIDPNSQPGLGIAYGTASPYHLLNVRTDRIGAFPDAPEGFYAWLSEQGNASAPSGYAPRALYGSYIQDIFQQALAKAKKRNIGFLHLRRNAVDIRRTNNTYEITLADGSSIQANAVVIATGNLPPRRFAFEKSLPPHDVRYVPDIWKPAENSLFPARVSELSKESEIVIIGTGLTTVDAVLTLHHQGFKGKITAISRHGLLPAVHADTSAYPAWALTQSKASSARQLFIALRKESHKAEKEGAGWRSVIDSLRPVTQGLWQALSDKEKTRFVRHLLPYWNIHRHRMAPEIHAKMQSLINSDMLRIVAGKIENITADAKRLTVTYRPRYEQTIRSIHAACVLNCTGPQLDVKRSDNPLLHALLREGMVTPDAIGMGLLVAPNTRLFLMGALRTGELLESTAVPELRVQAQEVASGIVNTFNSSGN